MISRSMYRFQSNENICYAYTRGSRKQEGKMTAAACHSATEQAQGMEKQLWNLPIGGNFQQII
jgi:hypothetical protein